MGDWDERNESMAQRAVKSEYFKTGEEQTRQRVGPEWINKDSDWYFEEKKDM
jgi:4-hydroxy-3-polyprenylbenzoate decarboxylase